MDQEMKADMGSLGPTLWLVANRLKDQLTQQLQTPKQLSRIKSCTCGGTTQPESRLVRLGGRELTLTSVASGGPQGPTLGPLRYHEGSVPGSGPGA